MSYSKYTSMVTKSGKVTGGNGHWVNKAALEKRNVDSVTYHVFDNSGLGRGGHSHSAIISEETNESLRALAKTA